MQNLSFVANSSFAQLVDIFTKPLHRQPFSFMSFKLGVISDIHLTRWQGILDYAIFIS